MANEPYYPQGAYVAEVTGQALGKASTNTPQFALRFRVTPNSSHAIQSYERTMFRAITSNTIDYFLEDLKQLGYHEISFGPLDPSHPQHHSFVGQQIEVYCKHEKDLNGQLREKWQLSRGTSGLKVDPLDAKGVRELDSMFGRALKSATPAAKPPQPVAAGSKDKDLEITYDDVPF